MGNTSKKTIKHPVSVIIPIHDEDENIEGYIYKLSNLLQDRRHEILLTRDKTRNSTVTSEAGNTSIAQSIQTAQFDLIVVIGNTYPAEVVETLITKLELEDFDIVVGQHSYRSDTSRPPTDWVYQKLHRIFAPDLNIDLHSSLYAFTRNTLDTRMSDVSPHTLDFQFVLQNYLAGSRIGSYLVPLQPHAKGHDQRVAWRPMEEIRLLRELISALIQTPRVVHFTPSQVQAHGQGFYYKGKRYVSHNSIPIHQSALHRMSRKQMQIVGSIAVVLIVIAILSWHTTLVIIISILTILYFADLLFNLLLIYRSYGQGGEIDVTSRDLKDVTVWPEYTIFCPLYKEAIILPQFVRSMKKMDYPKSKLQVLLLLEEDDTETIRVARSMRLPRYFKIVVVPHSMPKTKPKACNYGLALATGEYAVIYDAEDMPDTTQLKKAVVAFRRTADQNIGCVQAKLNFYNWEQNLLTRLFTLEYSLWFDLVLTGLQSLNAPIPLGGTSNHFKVAHLRSFGGWDPFNVTEDADLGIRLSGSGYRTVILNSVTLEEANSHYTNWLRQRSRWIKGYIQTYFVHTRRINTLPKKQDYLIFQLIIGGKVIASLVNPLFWILTLIYAFSRSPLIAHFVQSLFVPPVFYIGTTSLVLGNFLYMYYYMLGAAKRKNYELISYAFFIPLYWLMMSFAAYKALKEFIVRPFYWQKTQHGLHLTKEEQTTGKAA